MDGVFTHLAIVNNPRYERANIVFNSKTVVKNDANFEAKHPRDEQGKFTDDRGAKSFKEQIKAVETGQVSDKTLLNVLDKPSQVWKDAGLPDKPLVMSAGVYKKVTETKHNVDKTTIERLPELIQDPLYIFKSSTQPNSFVGVLDAVENKEKSDGPLIVAIKPGQNGLEVNIITSTYGKDKDFINRELSKGNLLYKKTGVSNRKASIALKVDNLSDIIITDNQDDFNPDMKNKINNDKIISGLFEIISELDKAAKKLNKNDYTILNGLSEILENYKVQNGWITLRDKIDDEGNPLRIYIPDYIPSGGAAIDFHHKINAEKNKSEIVYEFTQTRANISDEQKNHIKGTIDKALSAFKIEPPLRGVNVCTIGQGCLGVAITSKNTRTLSLDSRVFKEKGTEAFNKSVEAGWLARTDRDVLTSVLTHELGHTITATANNEAFWDKIKEIKSEYVKNIKENDTKNPDFVSNYARKSKDEFVAECFAQATLSKKPSRYAKMVLDEIKNHFKISAKEYKQLRLFNAIIGVLEMDTEHNIKNDKENDEIIWIEGEGAGYCLTEEEYEERKTEVEKHKKDELKK